MKPTKNRIYCIGCRRHKMLFETKKNADNFIFFNQDVILDETGKAPVRSYYCVFCSGWHVTSNPSLEYAEEQDKRDLDIIESNKSKNIDIIEGNKSKNIDLLPLKSIIDQKFVEFKKAIYTANEEFDIYGEYEYCKSILPELTHLDSSKIKSRMILKVTMILDILSYCDRIKSMDLNEFEAFIGSLNLNEEKYFLIKRHAEGKLIDLLLERASGIYREGKQQDALKIKEQLLDRLKTIEGEGRKKFISVYKNKITKTFENLLESSECNNITDEYKDKLLILINNLVEINNEFENFNFSKCISLVKKGLSQLSKLPKDKNVSLLLDHYKRWENTLNRI